MDPLPSVFQRQSTLHPCARSTLLATALRNIVEIFKPTKGRTLLMFAK
jgi:hypothetical protein